jgi:glycosyltransferase involved in cell wall biosynthesis
LKNLDDCNLNIHELILLNNGKDKDFEKIIMPYLGKYNTIILENETNVGLIKSYNQLWQKCTGDWLAFLHNDIIIYEEKWDKKIEKAIKKSNHPIGIVGFAGAVGIDRGGCRMGFSSNLKANAECHGKRITTPLPCVIVEGAVLICNMQMLNYVGGFFDYGSYHYVYDYDISLSSIKGGFYNLIIPVSFDHLSGGTYATKEYAKEFPKTKEINDEAWWHWNDRWRNNAFIPLTIKEDWTYEKTSR